MFEDSTGGLLRITHVFVFKDEGNASDQENGTLGGNRVRCKRGKPEQIQRKAGKAK